MPRQPDESLHGTLSTYHKQIEIFQSTSLSHGIFLKTKDQFAIRFRGGNDVVNAQSPHTGGVVLTLDSTSHEASSVPQGSSAEAVRLVREVLAEPTRVMVESMSDAVASADAALMDLSGYR
ncbi:MAG: hypothetical protein FRX48_09686 [Lasallia pustulata]|uniref:Uncharacterized protein n=1 Tax=Lasallia pustulata TaxID=136370 RepID=A0A5M8PB90_9LECA|nr:MAG: hypothetical protein FRX48_09686 [Lasallia pustulata]